MKAIITIFTIFMLGFIVLLPNSEIHKAKASKLYENKTTFTPENVINDPETAIHSIKLEYQEKLKASNERLYSLAKQKNRLLGKTSSNHGQISFLRSEGNQKWQQWTEQKLLIQKLEEEKKIILANIEQSQEGNVSGKNLKKLENSLVKIEESISLGLYELERLNIMLLDYGNRINNLTSSAKNSKKELEKNLENTKQAYAFETNLRRDLDKIITLEFDAAIAGKDFGMSRDGDLKLLANMAEIKAIEELLERQSLEYISDYTADQQISNSELLLSIQEQGF